MEDRFSSQQELGRRRPATIPRKPVGGHQAPVIPGAYMPQRRPSVEAPIPIQYVPYRSPIEEPSATFQCVPYRSPMEDVPAPLQYIPYRSPTDALGALFQSTAYRRPSAARSSVSRGMNGSFMRGTSEGSMSNDAVSPISPISSPSHFRRPSVQSVDDVINSISREVSQYQANDTGIPRMPLSPLMELSAQEAAFRNSVQIASPLGSPVRSRAATVRSLYQDSRRQIGPRSYHSEDSTCHWLPTALRWQFVLLTFALSIGLAALILGLTIESQKQQGLGLVQDSSIFFFGWRFTPTLLTVIYTIFVAAIVKDVKRTEPFARLSRPDGASAAASLFLKFRGFGFDLFDALSRRKNGGFRNWALFWASLAHLLGLLILAPFSSALLSPREVAITRGTTFSRLITTPGIPLELSTDDSILFRTTSSILLNTTTSAWVSSHYAVLPFWPSDRKVPNGAILSRSDQEWTAHTTVYETGLECSPMTLQKFDNFTLARRLPSPTDISAYELTNLTSFILESEDGCSLGFAGYPAGHSSDSFFKTGGGWWSSSPNFSYPSLWNPGNGTLEGLDADHPIMLNTSSQCGDRSMFIFATSYKEGDDFKAQGQICKSTYLSADLPVTVSNDGSSSRITFDEIQFNISKSPIDSSTLDTQSFERAFLSQAWSSKFQLPDPSLNSTLPAKPRLGGPLILLGAQHDFDLAKMMANPNFVDQARQIKQRFFGESMQAALDKIEVKQSESMQGQTVVSEQRIVVSLAVGIILIVTLLLSSLMTGLVAGYTRLPERPLNLLQDPSSAKAIASLISSGQNTRPLFEGLDTSSEVSMQKQLSKHVFYLRHGIIYSYDARDAYQQFSSGTFSIAFDSL
jgi:hypothetical protein